MHRPIISDTATRPDTTCSKIYHYIQLHSNGSLNKLWITAQPDGKHTLKYAFAHRPIDLYCATARGTRKSLQNSQTLKTRLWYDLGQNQCLIWVPSVRFFVPLAGVDTPNSIFSSEDETTRVFTMFSVSRQSLNIFFHQNCGGEFDAFNGWRYNCHLSMASKAISIWHNFQPLVTLPSVNLTHPRKVVISQRIPPIGWRNPILSSYPTDLALDIGLFLVLTSLQDKLNVYPRRLWNDRLSLPGLLPCIELRDL